MNRDSDFGSRGRNAFVFIERLVPQIPSSLWGRLISGFSWALVVKLSSTVLGVAVNGLLAHLLAPEDLGTYFLTFSLVSVSALIAQLGMKQTVVRLIAESLGKGNPGRARTAAYKVFLYALVGSAVVMAALYLGVGRWIALGLFESKAMGRLVDLIIIWVPIVSIQGLLSESFRGFQDIHLATAFEGLAKNALSAVLFAGLWVVRGESTLRQAMALSVVAGCISVLVAASLLYRKLRNLDGQAHLPDRDILRIAWPLFLSNLMLFVISQSSLWVLGATCPQEEVAVFGAVSRLVFLVSLLLTLAKAVVPPLIAEMYIQEEKRRVLESILRTTTTLAGALALLVVIAFFLFGSSILALLYGEYYRRGWTILVVLSVGHLVNVWTGPCGPLVVMTGGQKQFLLITMLSGLVTVSLLVALVPSSGALGAAVISALNVGLVAIITAVVGWRSTGIKSWGILGRND